jgi:hypothetical protein
MNIFFHIYKVIYDLMSQLQERIPEVISSQKCHISIGPILSSYGVMDTWNWR